VISDLKRAYKVAENQKFFFLENLTLLHVGANAVDFYFGLATEVRVCRGRGPHAQ